MQWVFHVVCPRYSVKATMAVAVVQGHSLPCPLAWQSLAVPGGLATPQQGSSQPQGLNIEAALQPQQPPAAPNTGLVAKS